MSSTTRILPGLLAWIAVASAASAQVVDLDQLPWTLNSETAVFDGKTATYIYTGLRFSQGGISIESDEGRMTNGLENERHLRFSGNVVIIVNNGRIECDDAVLQFEGSTLSNAVVTGSPATYELRRDGAEDVTYAEAGTLRYDVGGGVIEFSDNAKITESGNEIASNFLLYNINERRIKADSTGADDDRVRITYTPANGTPEPETAPEDDSQ